MNTSEQSKSISNAIISWLLTAVKMFPFHWSFTYLHMLIHIHIYIFSFICKCVSMCVCVCVQVCFGWFNDHSINKMQFFFNDFLFPSLYNPVYKKKKVCIYFCFIAGITLIPRVLFIFRWGQIDQYIDAR